MVHIKMNHCSIASHNYQELSYLNFNKIKNNLGFTIIIVHLESFRVNTLLFDKPNRFSVNPEESNLLSFKHQHWVQS